MDPVERIRRTIHQLHRHPDPPSAEFIIQALNAVLDVQDAENPIIRPRDEENRPGGLLLLNPDLPTILVPDLHARTTYMDALIDMQIDGRPLLEGLLEGRLQVLCVGDGFHSENRGAQRWRRAWEEYSGGFKEHQAMDEEMREGLALMLMVMALKTVSPDGFHFLKGNHENVANVEGEGNRPFGKYAWEGQMVRDWFLSFLGPDILEMWAEFEENLPLFAIGGHFLVSHAEPRRVFTRKEIINYRGDDEVIFGFTWTGNGEAEAGSVQGMLDLYLGPDASGALYFGGHRPIKGRYGTRSNGQYVQFHNPDRDIVAILEPNRTPNPSRDIREIGGG